MTVHEFESVEMDWDRLYREFPDRYDEFARHQDADGEVIEAIEARVNIAGAVIADIGGGSGRYTRDLLERGAGHVICVEPCEPLLEFARGSVPSSAPSTFVLASAQDVRLNPRSLDVILAAHSLNAINARDFANNIGMSGSDADERYRQKDIAMENILAALKPGGTLLSVSVVPDGYGGELSPYILGERLEQWTAGKQRFLDWLTGYGASGVEVQGDFKFADVETAARVYGFVYGGAVAQIILDRQMTTIRNPLMVQWITV